MSVTSGNCSRIITYVRFMYFLKITFIFNILMHNCKSLCDQNAWKASLHISCMPPVYPCVCVKQFCLMLLPLTIIMWKNVIFTFLTSHGFKCTWRVNMENELKSQLTPKSGKWVCKYVAILNCNRNTDQKSWPEMQIKIPPFNTEILNIYYFKQVKRKCMP